MLVIEKYRCARIERFEILPVKPKIAKSMRKQETLVAFSCWIKAEVKPNRPEVAGSVAQYLLLYHVLIVQNSFHDITISLSTP